MLIIIVVVVALGIFEILSSVFINNTGKALPVKHRNFIELVKSTEDEVYRIEQINASIELEKITTHEANGLY